VDALWKCGRTAECNQYSAIFPLRYGLTKPVEQGENVDPEHAHRVPVPGGNVSGDLPRLERHRYPRDGSPQQGSQSSEKVDRMRRRENEEEGTCGIAGGVHALLVQLAPSEELSCEETESEDDGHADPRQGCLTRAPIQAEPLVHDQRLGKYLSSCELDCEAADDEEYGVDPKDRWKLDRHPVVDGFCSIGVEATAALPDDICTGQCDEQRVDGDNSKEKSNPITLQAIVRPAVWTRVPISAAALRRRRKGRASCVLLDIDRVLDDRGHIYFDAGELLTKRE
jgi:hypothetical protein